MQSSPNEQTERWRVQRHLRGPTHLLQPTFRKVLRPFFAALIVVRQHHAMRTVAHPIHETQGRIIEKILVQMILQQHEGTADARGLAKQDSRILRVMQHIHEQANLERGVRKRQGRTVERATCNLAARPHEKFNTLNSNVWTELRDKAADRAVATSDIQNGSTLRNLRRKHLSQDARAAFENKNMVPAADPGKRPGGLRCGGHLFQVVVANVGAAADAQHAQKKRSKNHLHAEEQPHGPEKDLANLKERAETAGSPLPGDPGATSQACK